MKHHFYVPKYRRMSTFVILLAGTVIASPAQAENTTLEDLIQMAEEVSERASQMAIKAKETNDYYQAQHAFALTSEAVCWVYEVFGVAQETSNLQLARAAQNAAEGIGAAIMLARSAAQEIAATDLDPDVAHAVNFLIDSCDLLLLQLPLPYR